MTRASQVQCLILRDFLFKQHNQKQLLRTIINNAGNRSERSSSIKWMKRQIKMTVLAAMAVKRRCTRRIIPKIDKTHIKMTTEMAVTRRSTRKIPYKYRRVENGRMVLKYFPRYGRWFVGQVKKTRVDMKDGAVIYWILYDDGDREEFEEHELLEFHQNYLEHIKNESKDTANTNRILPPTKKQKTRHYTSGSSSSSSIWSLLDPVNGKPVNASLIQTFVSKTPPPPECQLPPNLYSCIPEMVNFFAFMLIRERMQNGTKTTIDFLNTYHFLHNNRELDRGTAYFRSQILKLIDDLGPFDRLEWTKQVLAMSTYYRQCNKIETFEKNPACGIPRLGEFNEDFIKYLESSMKNGNTVFTCAYYNQGLDKYIKYCTSQTEMIKQVAKSIVSLDEFDMKSVCIELQKLNGIGRFLAWQIACDLEEARCLVRCFKPDDRYCLLGPGAEKGLEKIFGTRIYNNYKGKESDLACCLLDNMDYCLNLIGQEFPLWKNQKVTLKVIEHALCEFQKFAQLDAGHSDGQRRWRSRAARDERDPCPTCTSTTMVRCDTCHLIVCGNCQTDQLQHSRVAGSNWDCCKACHVLEQSEHLR